MVRSRDPERAEWGPAEYLLAAAVDALHNANWQRAGKGQRPKPVPRPGDRPHRHRLSEGEVRRRLRDLHERRRR